MRFTIRRAAPEDKPGWLRLRQQLWPEAPADYLNLDLDDRLRDPSYAVFVASHEAGQLVGFVETGLRSYGEGCLTSPVGYLEAWYVEEHWRGQQLGRDLVLTAEDWAREKGVTEMASDTWLENETGIAAHLKLGYLEAERLVHFVKRL
jgi:aminoglycoside 6'-N-acetyltransferase I